MRNKYGHQLFGFCKSKLPVESMFWVASTIKFSEGKYYVSKLHQTHHFEPNRFYKLII